jgi:hypothetical protein
LGPSTSIQNAKEDAFHMLTSYSMKASVQVSVGSIESFLKIPREEALAHAKLARCQKEGRAAFFEKRMGAPVIVG